MNDFYTLPVAPVKDAAGKDLRVTVKLPTGDVYMQVWKSAWGGSRCSCSIPTSRKTSLPQDRDITDSLYGGDNDTRIRQEIVLGIGGIRALEAMGLQPTVFHMNEGHSAFLALERIRVYMRETGSASRRPWKPPARATSSPPIRPCRPESICSIRA